MSDADTWQPFTDVKRDRWGRPIIVPAGGGKPVAYTRCTTFVGALEDTYNLEKWKMRMTALGLSVRQDLQLAVLAHKDDKTKLNEVVDQAVEAAKGSAAATTGTALHSLTQAIDEGRLDLDDTEDPLPPDTRLDLSAYRDVMSTAGLKVAAIEQFGVLDKYRIGGTWDRIVEHKGRRYIADLKTGSDIRYGIGKIAMQLSVYSRCLAYDAYTHERSPIDVDQNRAIVIHLPAGTGKAFLWWVDIAAAWPAVELAAQVRAWRARKDLAEPFEYVRVTPPAPTPETDPLLKRIETCTDIAELRLLWVENRAAWSQVHTDAAAARKRALA